MLTPCELGMILVHFCRDISLFLFLSTMLQSLYVNAFGENKRKSVQFIELSIIFEVQ